MNYLAHFALSYPDNDLMMGNFLADLVTHSEVKLLSDRIQKGVQHHRSIDAFTDRHPNVLDSKSYFQKGFRRYSGIVLDLFYDYLLHRHWDTFYPKPVEELIASAYQLLEQNGNLGSERAVRFASLLRHEDLLHSYSDFMGIEKALYRIEYRMKRRVNLRSVLEDVYTHYEALQKNFIDFYPQLMRHAVSVQKRL